ncbi:MAG TPA: hypothetical protein VIR27_02320 [Mycobacteriales bacterium]|jgi:hypothetical protein
MPRLAVLSSLSVAAVAAGMFVAGPAMASDVQTYCPFSGVQSLADGSLQFGVEANGAGCVVVNTTNAGASLTEVVLAPEWNYEVKRNDDGRVEVRFTESRTDDRTEVRVEPGKTEVK